MTPSGVHEQIVDEWLARAADDELNARAILRHRDGTPALVCFLSQQMTEKLLKGAMVYFAGDDAPKVHVLQDLARPLIRSLSGLTELAAELDLLSGYYVRTRYPTDIPSETITWDNAETAFAAAVEVATVVRKALGRT